MRDDMIQQLKRMEMKCIELSPKGHYNAWEPVRKMELNSGKFREELGHKVLFEDGNIRLWLIQLEPKERVGFTCLKGDFQVISHVQGFAVSHRDDGEIVLIQYKKGDVFRYSQRKNGEQVWDLENIGADPLEFVVIQDLNSEE